MHCLLFGLELELDKIHLSPRRPSMPSCMGVSWSGRGRGRGYQVSCDWSVSHILISDWPGGACVDWLSSNMAWTCDTRERGENTWDLVTCRERTPRQKCEEFFL